MTLDAVPWSKSKVSKWQSKNKNYNSNNYNNNRPQRPPSSNYDYDYNGNNNENDDYYAPPKPSRPTYHNNQFYHSKPQDSWHNSQQLHLSSHHSSSAYNFDNDQRPNRPSSSSDIITDNRPSNFPSHHNDDHHHQHNSNNNYNSKPAYSSNNRPSSFNDYSHNHHQQGGHAYKDGPHPQSYPHNGDGEWILVSTTKGYQHPKRNGQRTMSFKTQNSVGGSEGHYNDNNGIITAAESQNFDSIVRPNHNNNNNNNNDHHYYHHRPSPTKMTQQQAVKLSVLPLFVNDKKQTSSSSIGNGNYHQNDKVNVGVYKPSSSSYHGIIESDLSNQTVEESVIQAHAANTNSKKKKKRKVIKKKNYAVMRKNGNGNADSSSIIAAVGASLVPASLGLIAPMILGK